MYTTRENIEQKQGSALTEDQASYFENVVSGAVASYIDKHTGTTFGSVDSITVYVSGEGSDMLVIPTMHSITAVNSIDDEDALTLLPDYMTYPRGAVEKYALRATSGTWDNGFENIAVTGVLGYADIPDDIVQVATELAASALHVDTNQYKSEKVGDWQVVYNDSDNALSDDARQVLARYRRLSRSI